MALSETEPTPNQHAADKIKAVLKEKKNLVAALVLEVPSISYPCQSAKTGVKEFLLLNFAMHLGTLDHPGKANAIRYNTQHSRKFILSADIDIGALSRQL